MIMAQEEHTQKYSNSGGGGAAACTSGGNSGGRGGGGGGGSRSLKKMKQKKVPQRGLGVAQLEKIRLEEQQKKEAAALHVLTTTNPILSPSNSSSCLAVQYPPTTTTTFRPNNTSISSCSSTPNIEILHPKPVPLSKPLNVSGSEIGWSAVPPVVHGNWPPKVWNDEYNLDGENQRLDHHGFRYRPNVNLAYDSISTNPFLPLPNFMPRSPQIQPPSSSSLVNISTGISSSPVMNFQMEPPSNQNICANNYAPMWPDEEKIIGTKRPYPFSMETPPAPAFHFKFPPSYVSPISRLDEPASCSNRSCVSTDPSIAVLREGPPRPIPLSEPAHIEAREREPPGGLNGDFLSLAPPAAAASSHFSSKHKQSLSNSGLYSRELSEFRLQPSQGSYEDTTIQGKGSRKSTPPPFYSFFPSPKKQIAQAQTPGNNCNGEVGENVDLSLKL